MRFLVQSDMDWFASPYVQISLGALTALILFIFAIDNLSKEVVTKSSARVKQILSRAVHHRFLALSLGAVVTALVQSSAAVTIMTLLLVNAGVISFRNSLAILFGSNIGTTVTAQLALIDTQFIGAVILIVGAILRLIGGKLGSIAKPIFYFGFILFALQLLSLSLAPVSQDPRLLSLFVSVSSPLAAYGLSVLVTTLVQSSSVTTGVIVVLVASGILPFDTAIPMILGANLGSSTTALLASVKLDLFARRTGIANVLFNLTGSLLFLAIMPEFTTFVSSFGGSPAQQVANAHLIFNVGNSLLFLLVLPQFEKLILRIVPGSQEQILLVTQYLNPSRRMAQRQHRVRKELRRAARNAGKIFATCLPPWGTQSMHRVSLLEELNDYLDDQIMVYLSKNGEISKNIARERTSIRLLRISNTLEQIGDIGKDLLESIVKSIKRSHADEVKQLLSPALLLIKQQQELLNAVGDSLVKNSRSELFLLQRGLSLYLQRISVAYTEYIQNLSRVNSPQRTLLVDVLSMLELSALKMRIICDLLTQSPQVRRRH